MPRLETNPDGMTRGSVEGALEARVNVLTGARGAEGVEGGKGAGGTKDAGRDEGAKGDADEVGDRASV